MFEKLEDLVGLYEEMTRELLEPDVSSDADRYRKLLRDRAELAPLVGTYEKYKKAEKTIRDSEEMLSEERGEEMRGLLKDL